MITRKINDSYHKRFLLPVYGFSIFFLLYVLAAAFYPGGSNVEKVAAGFSLLNNYWCDLMADNAKNGDINPARPIAITAWIILCISLSLFWVNLPRLFYGKSTNQQIVQYTGSFVSMGLVFSFTKFHDTIIDIAAILGAITIILTSIELKRNQYFVLWKLVLFCFFLGSLNYFIYTTNYFISKLPILQKITYLFCLLTFGLASYRIYQKEEKKDTHH
jgi:hypothetical protein